MFLAPLRLLILNFSMLFKFKGKSKGVNGNRKAGSEDRRKSGHWHFTSALAALILVSGCTSTGWKREKVVVDGHHTGATVETRKVAREAYLFAQLSENAYGPFKQEAKRGKNVREEYKLPSYISERKPMHDTPRTGFSARVYDLIEPGKEPYVIVAFRGTNFTSPADWFLGNIFNTQYKQGLRIVRDLKQQGSKVRVTGHSLGGGIATWVSLQEENVPAFGFNASHRLTRGRAVDNYRLMVSQYGEIGVAFRRVFRNPSGKYRTIPFVDGGPLGRHSMRSLADGLTSIAAADGDPVAVKSVEDNKIESKFPLVR